jgi:formylglycine-generating enzyme required for sulfatase activity
MKPGIRTILVLIAALGLAAVAAVLVYRLPGLRGAGSGASLKDCADCPEMILIPAGEFMMGSPDSELFRGLEPQHRVTVPSFALGKYEITFAEWDACVAGGGCMGPAPSDQGWGRGNHPLVDVTWEEANAYIDWLNQKTGKRYRLPSEAEWEYAARAGTTTAFAFGDTISTKQANYDGTTAFGEGQVGENRQQTVPVGSFPPNRFGLYDMHGNAWEWTEDCFVDGYGDDAPKNGGAYRVRDCGEHVVRGGSWVDPPQDLRSAARGSATLDTQSPGGGFRVARAVP